MTTAFGKVILFGEHAAVYNRPALAMGLPNGLVVESCVVRPGPFRVRISPGGIDETAASDSAIGRALEVLQGQFPDEGLGCEVTIRAAIPLGAGLGSSAALSVLLVRAVAEAKATRIPDDEVRRRAHELERRFHGNPSGLDDTVATYGGLCLFKRDGWADVPPAWPRFERVTPQALKIDCPVPPVAIGDSGVPRATHSMVEKVRRRVEIDPSGAERLFDRIGACTMRGVEALRGGDVASLASAIRENQLVLDALDLGCPATEDMIGIALDAGAAAAKITGAGGGGCVIALAPGREDRVVDAWRTHGFNAWRAPGPTQEGLS